MTSHTTTYSKNRIKFHGDEYNQICGVFIFFNGSFDFSKLSMWFKSQNPIQLTTQDIRLHLRLLISFFGRTFNGFNLLFRLLVTTLKDLSLLFVFFRWAFH